MLTLILTCIDTAFGRLDYASLSDQTRMEMFISGTHAEGQKKYQDVNGSFFDIELWSGVKCDDEGNVTAIRFLSSPFKSELNGTLHFEFVPPKTCHLHIMNQTGLDGTLETSALSRGLEVLRIYVSHMQGSVDMTALPEALKHLKLASNDFSGECDLRSLPKGLETFDVTDNSFSGSVVCQRSHRL